MRLVEVGEGGQLFSPSRSPLLAPQLGKISLPALYALRYFIFSSLLFALPPPYTSVGIETKSSGLRYMYANIVAWMHYFFLWLAMISGFCCGEGFGSFFTQSAALVPILVVRFSCWRPASQTPSLRVVRPNHR